MLWVISDHQVQILPLPPEQPPASPQGERNFVPAAARWGFSLQFVCHYLFAVLSKNHTLLFFVQLQIL